MQNAENLSQEQIREFLESSREIEFAGCGRAEIYAWTERVLVSQEFGSLGKRERGMIRAYVEKVTGRSSSQMTRLIRTYLDTGRVRHFLFFVGGMPEVRGIYLGTLDSKDKRLLVAADAGGAYAAPRHLLFPRGSTLLAQPFDLRKLQPAGEPVRAVEQVAIQTFSSGAAFSVSKNGTLAYLDGDAGAASHLIWFDREGKRLGTVGEAAVYTNPSLSPEGSKLAVGRMDIEAKTRDIWVFDLARGSSTRLTFDPADHLNPLWSPDGRRIAFTSSRKGPRDLYWKASDGAGEEEVVLESNDDKSSEDWSRDGKLILFNRLFRDVWVLRLEPERKATPVLHGPFTESQGQFSPNGRWIAYRSNESGREEVFVQTFPPGSGKWQISTGGGSEPQWRRDGKELFFMAEGKLLAVETKTETAGFEAGVPKVLFETPRLGAIGRNRYVVSPDGRRFLLVVTVEATAARPFTVVVNWAAELGR